MHTQRLPRLILTIALIMAWAFWPVSAQASVPCKELGGTQHSCFPAKEIFRTHYDGEYYYFDDIQSAASKAASLAYNNISGFSSCNFGLLTHEINVGPDDETRLHGGGWWEGYTNLDPTPGELLNRATVLWGQSINSSNGKTVWHKCRTHPAAGIYKLMRCPEGSDRTVNYLPGKSIYMCISKPAQNVFVRPNIPDPATSRDVNPEGSSFPTHLPTWSHEAPLAIRIATGQPTNPPASLGGRTFWESTQSRKSISHE